MTRPRLERFIDIDIGRRFDMNRGIMLGDVSMFGPESGQKYVVCKIYSRNYVFGREGDKSPKSLTNEGEGNVNSEKKTW
jgi:hypothetical protein